MTKDEWVGECVKELTSAGFNWTAGITGYAEHLAEKHYPEGVSPKAAVANALSCLE